MIEIIKDTLLDTVKLLPFLFFAFLIIEVIEHKLMNKSEKIIKKSGKLGPLLGSVLGAIPQCGFSVIATNLYITRIISLGTLISIYLSTSDEMFVVLISHGTSINIILKLIITKVIIGLICGYLIDLIYRKKKKQNLHHICEHDHCECEESLLKSIIIHTFKTATFILFVNFILNIIFNYFGEELLSKLLLKSSVPNCGASIMLTELFLNNIITYNTCLSGLLTSSGISLAILFRSNNNIKENISIIVLVYLIGSLSGLLLGFIC